MTSPEHALVGIHAALALGVHRKLCWQAVAIAAVASILPDWDGLLFLVDITLFDQGHRVWGHNLISIVLTSFLLACCEARWGWVTKCGCRVAMHFQTTTGDSSTTAHNENTDALLSARATFAEQKATILRCSTSSALSSSAKFPSGWVSLTLVAVVAQLVHLPCDMVVSGGKGLSDWAIQPWWPFSDRGYVFPLIPWGDVGPTVILMAGVLMSAKLLRHVPAISGWTLFCLAAYLVVRGWMRGML